MSSTPRSIRAAVWLFRTAAGLLPLSVDGRWAERMAADFETMARDAWERRGGGGLLGVTVRAHANLLAEALRRGGRPRGGMDGMGMDVRYALRGIMRAPGVAAVVVVTLALALGANTTLFSVVHGVMLRPLPYDGADELVTFVVHYRDGARDPYSSWPDFQDWRRELSTMAGAAAVSGWSTTLSGGELEARRLDGMAVSEGFFETLRLEPSLGRWFSDEELRTRGVVVLSHGLWTETFGADPAVVGTDVLLNGRPHTVLGVGPERFGRRLPAVGRAELWVPSEYIGATGEAQPGRASHNQIVVGRLAEDATVASAQAELDPLMAALEEAYPDSNQGKRADILPLQGAAVGDAARSLLLLLGAVGTLLLIAVANVTSVLLGRATERQREMALRSALGAGRGRLASQLVVESLLLAGLGGALGVGLSYWGTASVLAWGAGAIPLSSSVEVDRLVLGVSTLVTVAVGVVLGLAPAWAALRRDLGATLREGGTGRATGAPTHLRARNALVALQVALSLSLLIGSAVLVRSLAKLNGVDAGMDRSVLTFRVPLPLARYQEWTDHDAFHDELEERLRSRPSVREVASTNGVPLTGVAICGTLFAEEEPDRFAGGDMCAQVRSVTPDYFDAMGIEMLAGRTFLPTDDAESPDVVVVSRSTAELLWPGQDPLGRRLTTGFMARSHEVVGVVDDVKQFRLDEPLEYQTYLPHTQWRQSVRSVVVSLEGPAAPLVAHARAAVREMDPAVPVYAIHTVDELRASTLGEHGFRTALLAGFALVALALTVVGTYGVVSFTVAEREREMAIRVSIGAARERVLRMVLSEGLRPVVVGVALGVSGGFAFRRALQSLIYEVPTLDPWVMLGTPALVAVVAVAAVLVPAGRATRVDPMRILREE